MTKSLAGQRPDLTLAQVTAVLVAGVPVAATLLAAFVTLRTARNVADAKRDSVAIAAEANGLEPDVLDQDVLSDDAEFFADGDLDRLQARIAAENPDAQGSDAA